MPPVLQQPPSQPIEVYGPDAQYQLVHGDAFNWLDGADENSIEAVVTDPPYGLVEYSTDELRKRNRGGGGVWRIPPSFDGANRSPLPRFTVLSADDRDNLRAFFDSLASRLMHVLVPGGHVFIATNPLVADFVYQPFLARGFEKRGEIIRLVQTLRGGDRPKNAEGEYPDVSVMPRSRFEPWGLFRKPLEGRVSDNLRKWRTGGLRRVVVHYRGVASTREGGRHARIRRLARDPGALARATAAPALRGRGSGGERRLLLLATGPAGDAAELRARPSRRHSGGAAAGRACVAGELRALHHRIRRDGASLS